MKFVRLLSAKPKSLPKDVTQVQELPDYIHKLNEAQAEAVLHTEGPLLVFAGAGSGKTRVLTYRILHLIASGAAKPEEILAVTFTNKAAREMKERVATLLGTERCEVWVSTFHSSCVRILRRHAAELGYTSDFVIYDRNDSLAAIKRVMKLLKLDPKQVSPRFILTEIDKAKNNYLDPDSLRSTSSISQGGSWGISDHDERVHEVYQAYQEELLRSNAMDFGDLLCNLVTLFSIKKDVLEYYQRRFRYILVDEYQDTNKVQYLLVQQLAAASKNLCVVGDDDQSIYAFRGASIENILSFQNDFPDARRITLAQNYRSTKCILAAAMAVIAKNNRRQAKELFTQNDEGEPIVCYCAEDERDEARFVAEEIEAAVADGVALSEIAIFYRTNAQSRAFEEEFSRRGIAFRLFGGLRFYERKEIKDILSYLRLLLNPDDNEAFLRVVNTPARGIGASSIQKLQTAAFQEGLSLFEMLKRDLHATKGVFGAAAKKRAQEFLFTIEQLQDEYHELQVRIAEDRAASDALSRLLYSIAERSGYLAALRDEQTDEAQARIENIQELCSVAEEHARVAEREGISFQVQDFLDRSSLVSDLDAENTTELEEARADLGFVSMMTLHLAKGLEFRYAFLVGLEDGLLPHIRSLDSRAALEEERRLCYVGITRGMERLFMTRCLERGSNPRGRGWSSGVLSRFLGDLPSELVNDRGGFFDLGWGDSSFGY